MYACWKNIPVEVKEYVAHQEWELSTRGELRTHLVVDGVEKGSFCPLGVAITVLESASGHWFNRIVRTPSSIIARNEFLYNHINVSEKSLATFINANDSGGIRPNKLRQALGLPAKKVEAV